MATITRPVVIDDELQALEAAYAAPAFNPRLLADADESPIEADWAIAGAVAAILAIAVAIVIYICSVCQARSFTACYRAVVNYWTRGC